MNSITSFRGNNEFLSNFYPVFVEFEGDRYPSVENAFQAAKVINKEDRKVFQFYDSKDARKYGKKVPLRSDWDSVKVGIMEELLRSKFSRKDLHEKLRDTGNVELIESNTWGDRFWGVYKSEGNNMLGKLLMKIRDEFKQQEIQS